MQKPKKKRGVFFIIFLSILFLAGGITLYHILQKNPSPAKEKVMIRFDRTAAREDRHTYPSDEERKNGYNLYHQKENTGTQNPIQQKCLHIYQKNKNLLVLVNKEREFPEDTPPNLMDICNGRLQASPLLYSSLKEMLADASDAGYQYWIASAYRSRERQQQLISEDIQALLSRGVSYETALEETYKETQPVGHSEHETGLALDILCSENPQMTQEQEEEEGNKWLRENSWKYGFILRYPKEKEEITKVRYEPWHFRYVGKRAAKFIHRQDWTLEEFYQILEE